MRDKPEPETLYALKHHVSFRYDLLTEVGKPVDEARNELTRRALESGAESIIFADSDSFWLPNMLERLVSWLDVPTRAVFALCGPRSPRRAALAWTAPDKLVTLEEVEGCDGLLPCHFVGPHIAAMRRELLQSLGPNPWSLATEGYSEDQEFARRIHDAGGTIELDCRVSSGHVEDGQIHVAFAPSFVLRKDGLLDLAPTVKVLPFGTVRDYGAAVNAARKVQIANAGLLTRETVRKQCAEKVQAFPHQFRMPTESELTAYLANPS